MALKKILLLFSNNSYTHHSFLIMILSEFLKNRKIYFNPIFSLIVLDIFFNVTFSFNWFFFLLTQFFFSYSPCKKFQFQFHHFTDLFFFLSINYEMFETRPIWSSLSHFMMLFFRSLLCKRWKAKMKKKSVSRGEVHCGFFFLNKCMNDHFSYIWGYERKRSRA